MSTTHLIGSNRWIVLEITSPLGNALNFKAFEVHTMNFIVLKALSQSTALKAGSFEWKSDPRKLLKNRIFIQNRLIGQFFQTFSFIPNYSTNSIR